MMQLEHNVQGFYMIGHLPCCLAYSGCPAACAAHTPPRLQVHAADRGCASCMALSPMHTRRMRWLQDPIATRTQPLYSELNHCNAQCSSSPIFDHPVDEAACIHLPTRTYSSLAPVPTLVCLGRHLSAKPTSWSVYIMHSFVYATRRTHSPSRFRRGMQRLKAISTCHHVIAPDGTCDCRHACISASGLWACHCVGVMLVGCLFLNVLYIEPRFGGLAAWVELCCSCGYPISLFRVLR